MRVSEENSQKIKNMSLLCAALVVTCHIMLPSGRESSTWLVNQLVVDGVAKMAVPFFFVVSGYFLAGHFGENGWWGREIHKRIFSLVIPYFIWELLWTMMSISLYIMADWMAHRTLGSSIAVSWSKFAGVDLTKFPSLIPLWYVRCLLLFVIVSPVVALILKRLGGWWLMICFAASLLHGFISNEDVKSMLRLGFSLSGLFYFSFGCFLSHCRQFKGGLTLAICSALIAFSLLIAKSVCFYHAWGFQDLLKEVTVPFLMYATWFCIPAWRVPSWLTACSFPVFLMHMMFFPCVSLTFKRFQLGLDNPMLQPTLNWFIGFFGSIGITLFLRKVSPRGTGILFGGR